MLETTETKEGYMSFAMAAIQRWVHLSRWEAVLALRPTIDTV